MFNLEEVPDLSPLAQACPFIHLGAIWKFWIETT